jgi:hypothetical protein
MQYFKYFLKIIFIFLPWSLAAQEASTSIHCHGFSITSDADVDYAAENFFPVDYTFPSTARSNTFTMSSPEGNWEDTEVYCNDGKACVSNLKSQVDENGGYYFVQMFKVMVVSKNTNGTFNYSVSSKGADIDVDGELDEIEAQTYNEIGAFSCEAEIPFTFLRN